MSDTTETVFDRLDAAGSPGTHAESSIVGPPPPGLPGGGVKCDLCDRVFQNKNGLGVHKATIHGKVGPKSKRKTRSSVQRALAATPGPDPIDVDDILFATIHTLFPSGEIPIKALQPLMKWREATAQMLHEVK